MPPPVLPTTADAEIKVGKISTLLGSIEPFDPMTDRWDCWEERLDVYFAVNGVEETQKPLLLITFVGAEQYRLLATLTAPQKPSSKTYKELVELMRGQYTLKRLLLKERQAFYARNQASGESLTSFDTELKSLADKCAFGDYLDDMLRDRFVLGIQSEDTWRRLMVEEKIDYKKAVDMAKAIEQINQREGDRPS
ncbi:MAG: hypothetical protein GY737_15180, partial [Desulfobacteraceae bacterium]|nr:hypothetical protein [Desulfobacteraceae bacterium]